MRARASILFVAFMAGAAAASAADLLEVYRAAQTSDAVYAGARATWAAGRDTFCFAM